MFRFFSLLLLCITVSANAQDALQRSYETAYFAWDAGDYGTAIEGFQAVLQAPGGDRFLGPIALLTGERYRTVEVAPDGQGLRWRADGRYLSFETGEGPNRQTQVYRLEAGGPQHAATVEGGGLVFAPTGDRAAYLYVEETPALATSRAKLDSLRQARDFQGFFQMRQQVEEQAALQAQIREVNLATGESAGIEMNGPGKQAVAYHAGGKGLYLVAAPGTDRYPAGLYLLPPFGQPRLLIAAEEPISNLAVAGNHTLVYSNSRSTFGLFDLSAGTARSIEGLSPTLSQDGNTLAYFGQEGDATTINVLSLNPGGEPRTVKKTTQGLAGLTLSADGSQMAYQMMVEEDWELFVAAGDGEGERQVTREIQHDLFPQFLADGRLLGIIGEGRHRRSYLYDLDTGTRTRLFHNNTIRTVAPEYEWAPSLDGTKLLIVSERDGDTISPERGVYLVDLTQPITKAELLARLQQNLEAERDLRMRGEKMFAPISADVAAVTAEISTGRIYHYAHDLYQFDAKFITQPGNQKAIDYLVRTLQGFGYEPVLQWFEPRPGVHTANVVATLPGTVSPELVYVISSHFDSVARGPGADDNSSGTTALLEAARVMAGRPMPATIQFAFFTGEEAGLLGSREFVRLAIEEGVQLAGALNNDMVGWANNHRLDNTIRYSNAGLRDLQHAAAFLFTGLITYDAKYYKSTDAHAYYDAYGDIVAGIGSYPILGNPHYHQSHDRLETINHPLVAEVSKTTVASIMLMASSPARLKDLAVTPGDDGALRVTWSPAPEHDVTGYLVRVTTPNNPPQTTPTDTPHLTLSNLTPGTVITVKAINSSGLAGWDWAHLVVP